MGFQIIGGCLQHLRTLVNRHLVPTNIRLPSTLKSQFSVNVIRINSFSDFFTRVGRVETIVLFAFYSFTINKGC